MAEPTNVPPSMVVQPDDKLYEYRTKARLASKMATEFLAVANGEGLSACMAVLIDVATNAKCNGRTRANAAAKFLDIAAKAADHGVKVAIQNNPGATPDGAPRPDRGFWQAALADVEARRTTLLALSEALGVPAPVKATVPAASLKPVPVEPAAPAEPPRPAVRRTTVKRASS